MKIGVISDIHGNQYALTAVLTECIKDGISRLLVLGDLVGYYYHPELVLKLLSEWDCQFIKGNHEVILEQLWKNKVQKDTIKKKYGSGHEVSLKKLKSDTLQSLFSLPVQKSMIIDNISFQLNHGTPWSIDEYLYPDTAKDILEKCNSYSHEFVLIGHSHYSFSYRCLNSTLINCGSIGQSRQKGGLANWVTINTKNRTFEIKSTPYNISELLKEINYFDPDFEYASKVLLR